MVSIDLGMLGPADEPLPEGTPYWTVMLEGFGPLVLEHEWRGSDEDLRCLERRLVFLSIESARNHANAVTK